MEFDLKNDIQNVETLLGINDSKLSIKLGVSRMTISRIKSKIIPNKNTLETFYSFAFDKGIRLNLINEELYKGKEDKNNKILFHGSKEGIIGELSLSYSGEKKDFGKGFYLGESVKQGISFVSNYDNACLYIYSLNTAGLKIKEFEVDEEWMVLVAYFRGRIDEYKDTNLVKKLLKTLEDVDVVIAPIADNSMYNIINEFIEGSITDKQCVNSLSANRLGKQYVILNENVLKNNLTCLKKCYLCEKEKKEYENIKTEEKNVGKSKMILAKREFAGQGLYIDQLLK